jgi:uncharacterized protein (TIGR02646 family)
MNPCSRPSRPAFLAEKGKQWSERYSAARKRNPSHKFQWATYEGKQVNHLLLEDLVPMTSGHCSYCDTYPTDVGTIRTIDHFKPKTQYPLESYMWENLYLACVRCQSHKLESYHRDLLRPDAGDYDFNRYFLYSEKTGKLDVNPAAPSNEQRRARKTIELLGLNHDGLPEARKRTLRVFRKLPMEDQKQEFEDQPFRYILAEEIHSAKLTS